MTGTTPKSLNLPSIFAFMLVAIIVMPAHSQEDEALSNPPEIIKIITGEWSPYVSAFNSWGDAPLTDAFGLATEILNTALQQCGVSPRFVFEPWEDVLQIAEKSDAIAFPFRHSEDRAKRFVFSKPMMTGTELLFFNPNTAPQLAHVRNIAGIAEARLVFVKGYEYADMFDSYRNPNVPDAGDEKQAFKRVIDGEADAIVADKHVGNFILKTFFPDKGRLIEVNNHISSASTLSVVMPKRLFAEKASLLKCLNKQFTYINRYDGQKRIASRMQLEKDSQYQVLLDGPSDFPVAVGTEEIDSDDGFLIPRGTVALVLMWDDAFKKKQNIGDRQLMYQKTQVKLLSGPLEGRVLWVPNIFLRQ